MKTSARTLALCGLFVALSVVILTLTVVLKTNTITLLALAGAMAGLAALEAGYIYGTMVYVAVSLLGFLVIPDKNAVLLYILFFGWYPVAKLLLEKCTRKWLTIILKILVFHLAFFLSYGIIKYLVANFSVQLPFVLFILASNVAFWVYDYALNIILQIYIKKKWFKK